MKKLKRKIEMFVGKVLRHNVRWNDKSEREVL